MEKIKISKKVRAILVIVFIALYLLVTYISLRGQYLEYLELGEQYVEKFFIFKIEMQLIGTWIKSLSKGTIINTTSWEPIS